MLDQSSTLKAPLLKPLLISAWSREAAISAFCASWDFTELLFSSLKSETDFLVPPGHGLRFPMMFYYGHSAVFYINKLREAGVLRYGMDEELEGVFAMGVDENSWDDLGKTQGHWPTLARLREYRRAVRRLVIELLQTHEAFAPTVETPIERATDGLGRWAFLMGLEHERIHLETSAVLLRELPLQHLQRPAGFPPLHPSARAPAPSDVAQGRAEQSPPVAGIDFPLTTRLAVAAGEVRLGREPGRDWDTYGWDCEFGTRKVSVPAFEVAKTLASNGDFFDFVSADGYRQRRYWSDEGWAWKEFRSVQAPLFWTNGARSLRTLFEEIPMPWRWPALVCYHEAKAYCAFRSERDEKKFRLLSEGEHHRLRQLLDPVGMHSFTNWYGKSSPPFALTNSAAGSPLLRNANIGFDISSEMSVDLNFSGEGNNGVFDLFGNAWQWCEDFFSPLEGFKTHALYPDYSEPAFDGKHHLLLGGSFASTGAQTTPWVRTNFRPHFLQMAGARLVCSVND